MAALADHYDERAKARHCPTINADADSQQLVADDILGAARPNLLKPPPTVSVPHCRFPVVLFTILGTNTPEVIVLCTPLQEPRWTTDYSSCSHRMTSQRELQKGRNAQVGLLMRTYRETFIDEEGQRGLTQEDLLRRMATVSIDYAERYSHATVSRWESGNTRPTLQRLQVFGAAVGLSQVDMAGLVFLAGLAPDYETALAQAGATGVENVPGSAKEPDHNGDSHNARGFRAWPTQTAPSLITGVIQFSLLRFFALGVFVVGGGFILAFLGWNDSWMPVSYVGLVTCAVLAQGFFLPGRDTGLSEFFEVSVFFLLTTPLLQFAPLRMDHYNFYVLSDFAGTHMPYMLALSVNLLMSLAAGMAFRFLDKWQFGGGGVGRGLVRRAAWVAVPPVVAVYAVVVVISNASVWIQLAVLLPVVAAVFSVLLILRDPGTQPSEHDRRFLLSTTTSIAIVTTALGILTILAIYVSPDLPMVLPDHNLLYSWEIDFAKLGYSREAALDKLNVGYMWHAMCLLAYMVFIIGGSLFVAVYRMGSSDDPEPLSGVIDPHLQGSRAGAPGAQGLRSSLFPKRRIFGR